MSDKIISLEEEFKQIQNTIRSMNPKHYTVQSEYHRLMYSYTLKLETIQAVLNLKNEA